MTMSRTLTILTDQIWRIVAQKRSETRARDLAQAVEQTPASIVMTDKHGVIRYINPAFTEITGYNRIDVEGQTPKILKSGETPGRVYIDLWSTISTGRTWNNRLRNRRKDGTLYWTNTVISPLRNARDQIIGYLGVGEDVTEQVKLEDQLRHAQKMEAIGQLTGGVAHDFNNLLGIIRGNLDLLQDSIGNPRRQLEVLREVLEAVETGSALTRRLLAFSRRQPLSARPSDLDQLVSKLGELFRRTLGEKIEVRHRPSPGLWMAAVDPHELEHVLLNLVLNARDAMPDGGVLSIDTSNVTLDEEYASQFEEVSAGDYVLLTVSDTGTGMPLQVLARAFDPFFTTKETGKGSGLGLSVAYGFAKQSRGHIRLYSEVGQGTTVKLYLPRAGWAEPATATPGPQLDASAASARILLVEDNPRFRRMSAAMLTGHGYDVVEAADGPEALLRLGDAGPFQLMITDVGLPGGMNGAEVAAVARTREPSLQVLYMSGYAEPAVLQNQEDCKLISKPFGRNELIAIVDLLLSGDHTASGAATS
jgi:two-component system, cell cycle sensor histidine kinase and response regulator CckA